MRRNFLPTSDPAHVHSRRLRRRPGPRPARRHPSVRLRHPGVPDGKRPDGQPPAADGGTRARANPHAADATGETLAIFLGPQGYITPQYYATKRQTAKVVPTWNYAAIHAYGTMRFIDDRDGKLAIVTRLTEHHEGKLAVPWQVSDAPADFIDTMLNSIIGFEMTITRLEGKWKMSQNRPEIDRVGVIAGLRADGQPELSDTVARVAGPAGRTA
jgi:transcriptional regulator